MVDNTPFATTSAPSFKHLYVKLPDAMSTRSSWSQKAETGLHMKTVTQIKITEQMFLYQQVAASKRLLVKYTSVKTNDGDSDA